MGHVLFVNPALEGLEGHPGILQGPGGPVVVRSAAHQEPVTERPQLHGTNLPRFHQLPRFIKGFIATGELCNGQVVPMTIPLREQDERAVS
jgi:hypothetical protein